MFSDIQNLYSFFPPINYPYLYTRKTTSYSRLIMAGIYLHIPFCKRRCIYCDFFSTTENDKKVHTYRLFPKNLSCEKTIWMEKLLTPSTLVEVRLHN